MRLMACFGVVVLLVILDSLSKALASAEETKRNKWTDGVDNQYFLGGGPDRFDRTLRGNSPKSFGRIPRTYDFVDGDKLSFDREIRWHSRRAPNLAKARPPRGGGMDVSDKSSKFLDEMSRRAWGPRSRPGSYNPGKRTWEEQDNFAYIKRGDEDQKLMAAVMDILDAKNNYVNKEE